MRRASLPVLLLLALAAFSERAAADDTYDVDVDEQPLASALQVLAEQLELQIVFFSGATEGLVAAGVSGHLTRSQAFDAILSGTDLKYVFLNERSVAIQPVDPARPPEDPAAVGERGEAAAADSPAAPADPPSAEFGMEEIVVTGTASRTRTKFESSVGISTFDRGDIARRAPSSTAALISAVPGFWVESTAGTTHGNVFARGIVQDGGYRYVGLIEDGLPVYPVFELSFYNPDQFIRVSESIARVEAVRGGTAPIFTAGAVGGTINFVNEAPSSNPALRVTAGLSDYGAHTVDMLWSAPVAPRWALAAGGYVRRSDGIRDPGYVADSGGQFRLELRRVSAASELGLYAKYLDDRSLFGVPIPLRGAPSNPVAVDGSAAGSYSLHSEDIRRARLPGSALEAGVLNDDLADGIHPKILTSGLEYRRAWGRDVSLTSHTRWTSGDVTFNGLFTGDVPQPGLEFAAERGVDPAFSYVDGGAAFDPAFLVQNHGHWAIFKEYGALQNDTRLNLSMRGHELALGVYYADFSMADRWSLGNLLLMDVGSRPRRLHLDGVTDPEGFTRYSFLNLRADYDGRAAALYLANEWEVNDRLRLDFGLRYDRQEVDGWISQGMDAVDLDGDPATRWDVAALAGDDRRPVNASFDHVGVSLGFNYALTDRHAAFGHFTRSAKLPHFDDVRNGVLTEDAVSNLELGYKASLDSLALFLTAYRTQFDNVPFSDILVDGSIIVRRAETLTWGLELEGVYEPVDSVSVQFSLTLQDPEYRNFSGVSVDNDGNQVRRIPRAMLRLTPSIWFAAGRGRAFLAVSHYGRRYANDENTIELPAYTKLDAGIHYSLNDAWSAQLNVDNLSNEVGLTEGNPRTDVGSSGIGQLYNARTLFGRSLMLAVRYDFKSG